MRARFRGASRRLYAHVDRCHSVAVGRSRLVDSRCRGGGGGNDLSSSMTLKIANRLRKVHAEPSVAYVLPGCEPKAIKQMVVLT